MRVAPRPFWVPFFMGGKFSHLAHVGRWGRIGDFWPMSCQVAVPACCNDVLATIPAAVPLSNQMLCGALKAPCLPDRYP